MTEFTGELMLALIGIGNETVAGRVTKGLTKHPCHGLKAALLAISTGAEADPGIAFATIEEAAEWWAKMLRKHKATILHLNRCHPDSIRLRVTKKGKLVLEGKDAEAYPEFVARVRSEILKKGG